MTPPGLTCAACSQRLYPALARATESGWTHVVRCPRICGVTDCDGPRHAHGYCQPHSRRWLKYGDPMHESVTVNREGRLEDVRWMAETGECLDGAARRLGLSRNSLEKWLERNERDVLKVLVARQPRDHNQSAGGVVISELTGRSQRKRRVREVAA